MDYIAVLGKRNILSEFNILHLDVHLLEICVRKYFRINSVKYILYYFLE